MEKEDLKIDLNDYSTEIIDVFENILDLHEINVPDEMRTGDEDEARIFGGTYLYAKDAVSDILKKLIVDFAVKLKISMFGIDDEEARKLAEQKELEDEYIKKILAGLRETDKNLN